MLVQPLTSPPEWYGQLSMIGLILCYCLVYIVARWVTSQKWVSFYGLFGVFLVLFLAVVGYLVPYFYMVRIADARYVRPGADVCSFGYYFAAIVAGVPGVIIAVRRRLWPLIITCSVVVVLIVLSIAGLFSLG